MNIRYDFHGSRSRAKVISLQPIPPFIFPLLSLKLNSLFLEKKIQAQERGYRMQMPRALNSAFPSQIYLIKTRNSKHFFRLNREAIIKIILTFY